jgi:hypothetical protein
MRLFIVMAPIQITLLVALDAAWHDYLAVSSVLA